MPTLIRIARAVTAANRAVAAGAAWCVAALVALTFGIAVARYALGWGSIALQESVLYLHALVFMACGAGTLAADAHVRVDIFREHWSAATNARIDAAGHLLFLLPFAGFLLIASWGYVAEAWRLRESSPEPGGLPALYLLKTLLLVLGVQLALQALASAVSAFALRHGVAR